MGGYSFQPWPPPTGPPASGTAHNSFLFRQGWEDPRRRWSQPARAASCERWTSRASLPAPSQNSFAYLSVPGGAHHLSAPVSVAAPPFRGAPLLTWRRPEESIRPSPSSWGDRAGAPSLEGPQLPAQAPQELPPRSEVTAALATQRV